jgi:uncharacterized membrane protein (UPF0127 family)
MIQIKNKITYKIQIGIIIFFVLGIFYLLFINKNKYTQQKIFINNNEFIVDIADTDKKRQLGLGNRKKICEKCGMLFLFDDKKNRIFWMKDMNFDIDIIWILDDKVVNISKNIKYNKPQKKIYSGVVVDKVLELPSGSVEKFGIIVGNGVHYEE